MAARSRGHLGCLQELLSPLLRRSSLPVALHPLTPTPAPPCCLRAAGPFRATFLQEAVADLRAALRAAGSELIVRLGKPEEVGGLLPVSREEALPGQLAGSLRASVPGVPASRVCHGRLLADCKHGASTTRCTGDWRAGAAHRGRRRVLPLRGAACAPLCSCGVNLARTSSALCACSTLKQQLRSTTPATSSPCR